MPTRFVYGPVPSRRLGLSLGVDTVAAKACPFDCIYCQLGPTSVHALERTRFFPLERILDDVRRKLAEGPRPDHITLGGSGEPTLNLELAELVEAIKAETDVPVALLSGGALFWMPEVRAAAALADVVLPSLDAGDEELFAIVNRPPPGLTHARVLEGLRAFRGEYGGRIWLEAMIVAGVSETPARLDALAAAVAQVQADRVQLNTPVRPAKDPRVRPVPLERLAALCDRFTPRAEVIAEYHREVARHEPAATRSSEDVLTVLTRRPCTLDDLATALATSEEEVRALVEPLRREGRVEEAAGGYLRPRS